MPDDEIVAGTPTPAIVPLPAKVLPPMPGKVVVLPKVSGEQLVQDDDCNQGRVVGSVALVDRSEANRNIDGSLINPGNPFWIAGLENTVGQLSDIVGS